MVQIPDRREPDLKVTVSAITDDSIDLFGKKASDLQEGIAVSDDAITGTLKYVTDYTGFSGRSSEQQGNYIAIHAEADDNTATVKVGITKMSTLDEDGDIVLIVKNTSTPITVTAEAEGKDPVTKTFSIADLVLTPES